MSKEFPTKPFYITSRKDFSNWVLEPNPGKLPQSLRLRHRTGTLEQLWSALPDNRDGYYIVNLAEDNASDQQIQNCLAATSSAGVEGLGATARELVLAPLDTSDALQLFLVEQSDDPAPWVVVRTFRSDVCLEGFNANWGCLNVYGGDPNRRVIIYRRSGDDDSRWNLVEEDGELTMSSIWYDQEKAVADLSVQPQYFSEKTVRNDSDTPLPGKDTISWQNSKSRTLTMSTQHSTGWTFSQNFGIKGGVKDTFEVSEDSTFTTSTSDTETKTDGTTTTETVQSSTEFNYSVPGHKVYRYRMKVSRGKVTVPYTATMNFNSTIPGIPSRKVTIKGEFKGVNVVKSELEITDITGRSSAVGAPIVASHRIG
jgi:hypothetical protein